MTENKEKEKNDSLEQEKKKLTGKDIEPQRDPVKPQEECKTKNQ
ncbi:3-methyladenine DNA glycosylase [Neobacillus notoginsengisoli]|uniref:3-methyladenine DNA glycosylase n=1 Tax=Neobacillus notoginsengisoli TaxID=1578198 RepID=A0A417YPX4_9BACI|nr:3-methyladenine DNA glycosylase [Neobacillus notoginsengisoli]RHW35670.1 3-methyladenine DNA glycosylase [Neobacillus notoginsengisoli]